MLIEKDLRSSFEGLPIQGLIASRGWKDIKLEECGEAMVDIGTLDNNLITIDPQYYQQGIPGALQNMYCRETTAKVLVIAAQRLPKGMKLIVWDAWRPLSVQQSLFDTFKQELSRKNPDWGEDKLIEETQTYVSLPSYDSTRPSPHNTGAAIDLSICYQDDQPIPMGVPFDHFGPESATDYYERLPSLTQDELLFRANRRILYHTMTAAGFSNYDEEYWHYDLGNQFDAVRSEQVAIYGAVSME